MLVVGIEVVGRKKKMTRKGMDGEKVNGADGKGGYDEKEDEEGDRKLATSPIIIFGNRVSGVDIRKRASGISLRLRSGRVILL